MPDDPTDTQARRMPDGTPGRDGPANAPPDAAAGAVRAQDGPTGRPGTEAGPGTEAEDAAVPMSDEPMTNEPLPVAGEDAGVGMTRAPEPDIDGTRGM